MTDDEAFVETYFDQVARLLDPKTGQPLTPSAARTRDLMRARLSAIRAREAREGRS